MIVQNAGQVNIAAEGQQANVAKTDKLASLHLKEEALRV
jgi:hypothetical protein